MSNGNDKLNQQEESDTEITAQGQITLCGKFVRKVRKNQCVILISLFISAVIAIGALAQHFGLIYKWYNEIHYNWQAKSPYPDELTESKIKKWTSGELRLADLQIQSYLNQVAIDGNWLDSCLSKLNELGYHPTTQVNREYKLKPTSIDIHNRKIIKNQLEQLYLNRTEEDRLLRISSLYERLAERSKTNLLYTFKDSELIHLDQRQLSLLRNQIFARYGRVFSTPKLRKYFSRKSWYKQHPNFNLSEINKVEMCNIYLLEEIGPEKDIGSFGRAVYIDIGIRDSDILSVFPNSVGMCLKKRNTGIEIYSTEVRNYGVIFRDYVDFLVSLNQTKTTKISYSLLDLRLVDKHIPDYLSDHRYLKAGLIQFASEIRILMADHEIIFQTPDFKPEKDYIGVSIDLSEKDIDKLKSDPRLLLELRDVICEESFDFLEQYGQFIP